MSYVAFVIDAYLPTDPGLAGRHPMRTALVFDALDDAVWTCGRDGWPRLARLVHHNDAGGQPSPRWAAWAYDNALAESVIGLYKTELIKPCGAWRTAPLLGAMVSLCRACC